MVVSAPHWLAGASRSAFAQIIYGGSTRAWNILKQW